MHRSAPLLALVLACSSPPKPPPVVVDVPVDCVSKALDTNTSGACAAKLGVGKDAYTPLVGDDTVDFFMGLQGGHHVYAGFLAQGYTLSGKTFVTERVLTPDGKELATSKYCAPLSTDPAVDGWREEVGHRVIFNDDVDPSTLDGTGVILELTLDDLADPSLCAPTAAACRARTCARVKLHDAGLAPPL